MRYSDSLREMMQNGLGESFWDGLGVEIEHAQISRENSESEIFSRFREKITEPRNILGLDALGP